MSLDKISNPEAIKHWTDVIPPEYVYTVGVAGERFFREIKENGRIMGTKCSKCGCIYLPPRIYCEKCFDYIDEWVDVGLKGRVYAYTVTYLDVDGSPLDKPIIFAIIKFDGVYGGLIHRLGEVEPEKVCVGMVVEAVFKDKAERKGSINDIKYFKPSD